jgi:hypothetical protein
MHNLSVQNPKITQGERVWASIKYQNHLPMREESPSQRMHTLACLETCKKTETKGENR